MYRTDPNTLGRGVIVKLRDGSVVKYKRATDFVAGAEGLTIVRRERPKRKRGRGWGGGLVTTRIANYPLSLVARVDLAGSGTPPPWPDKPKKAKVITKPAAKRR